MSVPDNDQTNKETTDQESGVQQQEDNNQEYRRQTMNHISKKEYYKSRRSGRHGARNQNRHKRLCQWLLQRFPQLNNHDDDNDVSVLDIAGGKGELAARLTMCHQIQVVMVDPRPAHVADCFERTVLPKLPKKWQTKITAQQEENPNFIAEKINSRFSQLCMCCDEMTLATCVKLQEAIQGSSLLIGMHADGATEAIVDAALEYQKPFCVVPCCVFPTLFSKRTIEDDNGRQVQVRSHEQFCQYLVQKDSRFVMETLPFEGRNVAIWWNGSK